MAVEDIQELKGYNKPSVYKGQKADRLISELGIGTVEDFNKLAREQGLGSFGKDKEATKFLNQLLTKAGKPNYSTVAPIQRAVEIELFGNNPKNTKMDRMVFSTRMEKISNAVQSMKKPLKEKIQYIGNTIKSYYPNISPKSVQSMIRLFSMAMGPSMIGADMMSEGANKEAMSKIFGETQSYAGGGIASMDDMIKPVGYKNGGETGFLTEPPPGMEFKPTMTMEYRDYNQNGKEDRSEGLYLPKDFQPIKDNKGLKKIYRMPGASMGNLTDEQKKRIAQLLG